MIPVFIAVIRATYQGVARVERYEQLPWLEDIVEGGEGDVLGCPTCMATRGGLYHLQLVEDTVRCAKCGDLWPLTLTAVVDLTGDAPVVVSGVVPAWPDDSEPCRLCGCTDALACPEGCWWIAPRICSTHDLAEAMEITNALPELFDPPPTHDFAACCAGLPIFRCTEPEDWARWRRLVDIGMAACALCIRTRTREAA